MKTVTRSARASLKEMCSSLMCPAGVGEKRGVSWKAWTAVGVCFSRWVMKNAAKHAITSSVNTPRTERSTPVNRYPSCGEESPPAPPRAKRSSVSERSPRRSVSSESTSYGAMFPRLHSVPKRLSSHTC